jgi:aminoglycoside 6'-N-acetyltransferase I
MRAALWPDDHTIEVDAILAGELDKFAVFVAERDGGGLCGFAEVGLRSYAEGCLSSPVGYLEGIWVDQDMRRTGVGRALVSRCEQWARDEGCIEFASDALLDNTDSHAFHRALGFEEVERLVVFRRTLGKE